MSGLRTLARAIRHAPGVRRADWLWNRLRPAYHAFLNRDPHGVPVTLGGGLVVRMPAEFTGLGYENYEVDCIRALTDWVRTHPGATLLDVGCSIAIFSLAGLTLSPDLQIIAFDADVNSLKATRRLCGPTGTSRLRLVQGLLTETHTSGQTLDEATAAATAAMDAAPGDGSPRAITYVYLDRQAPGGAIPRHSLDGLLLNALPANKPLLLKCDVEGAELLVLRGAEQLLRKYRPEMLISVHPQALPAFGQTVDDVRNFLHGAGYSVRVLAVDHEEHWWCERAAA